MIQYFNGDVIKAFKECKQNCCLIHGCNCFNTMGAGVAKQIKEQFPNAYIVDNQTLCGDISKLGSYTSYSFSDNGVNKTIFNAYTQYHYGKVPHKQFNLDYEALELALLKIDSQLDDNIIIYMPKIGAGLAGGDWNEIEKIINKILSNKTVYVYTLE